MTIEDKDRERLRVQDKELMQMTDDGMCLSMHQPWASLLVRGIKMYSPDETTLHANDVSAFQA